MNTLPFDPFLATLHIFLAHCFLSIPGITYIYILCTGAKVVVYRV